MTVHFVLPANVDDPATPSGGNHYDRRLITALTAQGRSITEHLWPVDLATLPDDALVVIDGLVASTIPELLAPQANRLRLVVLMHMPIGDAREHAALATARAVITTSQWTRTQLSAAHPHLYVATPGTDPAPLAAASPTGGNLLCVAAVTHHKGHDVLAEALSLIPDLPWTCTCVGSRTREPDFVRTLPPTMRLAGPLTGSALDAAYASADLLVLPSRAETYGMVITEALARGIPVLTTTVGGTTEALGHAPAPAGHRIMPGMLVPPDDPIALAAALRDWLTNPVTRATLRAAAQSRRATLPTWTDTAIGFSAALRRL